MTDGNSELPRGAESEQPAGQGPTELAHTEELLHSALAAQRSLEEELRRMEQKLRDVARRNDEFLTTLAHDLKNPLAPIRNGLQLLLLAQHDPSLLGQVHAIMDRQLQQINRIIDDLLDVSRISIGRLVLRKECLDLAMVVERAVANCRPLIDELGHDLVVQMPAERMTLEGDAERLTQVCATLLRNAANRIEGRGQIVLTVERQPPDVIVKVTDNGAGIPARKLPHVFEPYIPMDGPDRRGHGILGLELALLKQLTEMHGGTVEARNAGPDRGSEFAVRLPLRL